MDPVASHERARGDERGESKGDPCDAPAVSDSRRDESPSSALGSATGSCLMRAPADVCFSREGVVAADATTIARNSMLGPIV